MFFMPGVPVAKGRPKFAVRAGRSFAYTPAKTRDYEKAIVEHAKLAMLGKPLFTGALSLCVVAYVPIPASWSKKKQEQARRGIVRPVSRPDADNYSKIVMDALNCVVYADDAQVVDLYSSKYYSLNPSIHITLRSAAHECENQAKRETACGPSLSAAS